jgi:hypothetical protein
MNATHSLGAVHIGFTWPETGVHTEPRKTLPFDPGL